MEDTRIPQLQTVAEALYLAPLKEGLVRACGSGAKVMGRMNQVDFSWPMFLLDPIFVGHCSGHRVPGALWKSWRGCVSEGELGMRDSNHLERGRRAS